MTDDKIVDRLQRLCVSAVRSLDGSGAGVSLIAEDGTHNAACASDPFAEHIEELQFTLGEGPSIDAFHRRRPVLVPDLAVGATHRWPVYSKAVHEAGVRAVFAFPLQIGAARLGVLGVLRTRAGMLTREETTGALALANIAVMLLLDGHEHAPPDTDGLDGMIERRAELFQAQGMVMIQLGVSLTEALARIRAHAFGEGRRLDEVAMDIVARRLRFDQRAP